MTGHESLQSDSGANPEHSQNSVPEISWLSVRDRWWLFLFFSVLIAWIFLFDMNFSSDGERYYAWLRSAVCDGDLNFYNEYTLYTFHPAPRKSDFLVRTETKYLWNAFSIGPAVLWAPFFMVAHGVTTLSASIGYPILADGFSFPYLLCCAIGTLFYTLMGLACGYMLCRRFVPPWLAAMSVFLMYWSSPAPAYVLREPAYAHSQSFALISLFLLIWSTIGGSGNVWAFRWRYLLLALVGGLAALVRWQNCIVVIFPAVEILWVIVRSSGNPDGADSQNAPVFRFNRMPLVLLIAGMGAIAFLAIVPQMIGWKIIFGNFITVPQGEHFMHWTKPALLKVLFSPLNGLFVWHPLLCAGLLGLILLLKRCPRFAVAGLIYFLFQWYVNACVDDWFAGAAFGNRRFINCLPFFMAGFAAMIGFLPERIRKPTVVVALIFPLWNFLLLVRAYGGDLMGLVGLTPERMIQNSGTWFEIAWRFLHSNYFLEILSDGLSWPVGFLRFFFPLVLLGMFVGLFFLLNVVIQALAGDPSLFTGHDRPDSSDRRTKSAVLVGLVCLLCISAFLSWLGWRASIFYPVHLGTDDPGRMEGLAIASPARYTGSLTSIHLKPGNVRSFDVQPGSGKEKIWLIATLSGSGVPPQMGEQVLCVRCDGEGTSSADMIFSYPQDIDRMDRSDFQPLPPGPRAIVAYEWFNPRLQKRLHAWYITSRQLAGQSLCSTIFLENISLDQTVHITGIAFDGAEIGP